MAATQTKPRPPALTYGPLVNVVCALALGIALDRYTTPTFILWSGIGCLAVLIWLTLWLIRRDTAASWSLLASVLAVGGAWHHSYWRLYATDEISRFVNEQSRPMYVEAIAIQSPRW